MKLFIRDIVKFITNRIFIAFLLFALAFYLIILNLFDLQIINGESYQGNMRSITVRTIPISAPRGTIYDKFGRPLAINQSAFTIKFDPSIQNRDSEIINSAIYNIMVLFEKNDEKYIDNFPISKEEPYTFEVSETAEKRWKKEMDIQDENLNAEDTFKLLRKTFKIDPLISNKEARKILSLRSEIFLQRFRQYTDIVLAVSVKPETVAILEEDNIKYPGIYVEVEPLRVYPASKYLAHIVGYIKKIDEKELLEFKDQNYRPSDNIGKTGIELSLESTLRGKEGKSVVQVDTLGRKIATIQEEQVEPIQGDKVFLTIDQKLQEKTYTILEEMLKTILMNKMMGKSLKEDPITVSQVLQSMVMSNNISIKKIWSSDDTMYSFKIKEYVLKQSETLDISTTSGQNQIKNIIKDGIENNKITPAMILLTMIEQNIITADENLINQLKKGQMAPLQLLLQKIRDNEITPQMVNLDPSSASAIVVDVHTGDVITAVSYPSYDTNEYVNNSNNEYINKINNDPTSPSYNRVFMERRAPGSTFKMISAIAGLESGVITPNTLIYDETTFTKAGPPYASCISLTRSHGNINVVTALEVSCNYFFFEMAYRMGNAKNGNKLDSIEELNKYMIAFGLNEKTGVEIGEATTAISSPEYKEYLEKRIDPNAPKSKYEWHDGDTIRTAIGQSKNNYTAANMVKYIATLANGGTRYQLHLVDSIHDNNGNLISKTEPVVELEKIELKKDTLPTVFKGMYNVVNGNQGSARNAFANFPIKVGGKTGTAEEDPNRRSHSSFAGIAPFDDPQIAVYVVIPFGNSQTTPTAAGQVARDIIGEYMGLNAKTEESEKQNFFVK